MSGERYTSHVKKWCRSKSGATKKTRNKKSRFHIKIYARHFFQYLCDEASVDQTVICPVFCWVWGMREGNHWLEWMHGSRFSRNISFLRHNFKNFRLKREPRIHSSQMLRFLIPQTQQNTRHITV